jgi:hypothetical protein
MLIVPLPGDVVETMGGVKHTVLSFSNYGAKGPLLYVQADDKENKPSTISYTAVIAINNTPVSLSSGKIFKTAGKFKRKIHLPQPGDKVTANPQVIRVKDLKLPIKGDLSKGLLVVGEDFDSKEKAEASVRTISKVERNFGGDLFSPSAFKSMYKDYLSGSSK